MGLAKLIDGAPAQLLKRRRTTEQFTARLRGPQRFDISARIEPPALGVTNTTGFLDRHDRAAAEHRNQREYRGKPSYHMPHPSIRVGTGPTDLSLLVRR
jgi:hypothetical protein